ncbi:hypothetical protein [Methylomagnum sp.]
MARTTNMVFVGLLLVPLAARAQGGGGFSVPENPKPMGARERVDELKRTQEFLTKLHDLMHQVREAPNGAERDRLKAEQLRLLNIHVRPPTPGRPPHRRRFSG